MGLCKYYSYSVYFAVRLGFTVLFRTHDTEIGSVFSWLSFVTQSVTVLD